MECPLFSEISFAPSPVLGFTPIPRLAHSWAQFLDVD